jgi:hypothetical protein
VKPTLTLSPDPWAQLASGADLVVTWDATAIPSFGSIDVMIGTTPGDSDLGATMSTDPTHSMTALAASLPVVGLIHVTAFVGGSSGWTYSRIIRPAAWPDHTKATAELADRYAIEAALNGVTVEDVQSVAGVNWSGLEHFDVGDATDVRPSGNLAAPAMWARWQIAYTAQPIMCFDDEHAVTQGLLILDVFLESGASTAVAMAALALYRVALADFAQAADYQIDTEAATETLRDPDLDQWVVVRLALPFKGL